jgi:hypothetical protein
MTRRMLWVAGLLTAMAGVGLAGLAGLAYRISRSDRPNRAARPSDVALPPHQAEPEDEYVGLAACAECHLAQYRSYQQTAHSRALAEINLADEPADGKFEHAKSGRSYRIYRADGKLRHREWFTAAADVVSDYPLKYVIGSGHHTRSYLVEDDGFVSESPITWYASRQAWGLSPGFDWATHWGFERAADLGCVICHVGRAEAKEGSQNRILIHEKAIGCERCHGPGRVHVKERKQNTAGRPARNDAIINPSALPRPLQEALCAQCHLRAQATILLSGRDLNDFRPGRPLTDFRVDFQYDVPTGKMTVVGHVEQMRGSRCYQSSDRLTCTTCHDPHAPVDAADKRTYYRNKCLECHAETSCGVPLSQRDARAEGDYCAACHMPQVATDVPHVAFTHHRIGLHEQKSPPDASPPLAELIPMDDVSWSSVFEKQRALGLAYLEVADALSEPAARRYYRKAALEWLNQARAEGADAEIEAALARIYWRVSPRRAAAAALVALNDTELPPRARVNALFVLADTYFHVQDWSAARSAITDLLKLRRHSEDWRIFGLCQARSGDLQGAAASLQRGLQINPFRPELHEELGRVLMAAGQTKAAQHQQELARLLMRDTAAPASAAEQ